MISRPVQLPEVRAEQIEWLFRRGTDFFEACIKAGILPVRPDLPDRQAAEHVARAEAHRLHRADLYWVSADMTDLVAHAAASMPRFTLMPEDLPSPYGLIVFEQPLKVLPSPDDYNDFVHVIAASWGTWRPANAPHGHLWVSWYADTARNHENVDPRRPTAGMSWRRFGLPALCYENETQIAFSATPVKAVSSVSGEEVEVGASYPVRELRAAWTLMQQPIASVSEAHFDRAARRRFQRKEIEQKPVRVITLRRPKSTGQNGESDREYHHRWIVRGHWRQQWYPSRSAHRPVWIAPHIKGPEDAPFLGGEKVHAWTR